MPCRYETVLFDWDGCLLDSLPIWFQACQVALDGQGVQVSESEIARHIIPELKAAAEYGVGDLPLFIHTVLALVKESVIHGEFHSGALAILEWLQSISVPYAIVTSSERVLVESVIKTAGCESLLPYIVTRNDVSYTKPHPEPLQKALSLLNLQPTSAVMIGDNSVDLRAGQAMGFDTVLYHPECHAKYYDRSQLLEYQPTYVISSWHELKNVLLTE